MNHTFLVKVLVTLVSIAAAFGIIPAVWGPVTAVVLDQLENVPVENVTDTQMYAVVERVIDGDTIEVTMQTPESKLEMLRLIGVDTPETKHPRMPVQFFGPEATQFTKNLCLGSQVVLQLQKDGPDRGRYGRLLVYVRLNDGKILNEEIIKHGLGYSYTKYPHEKTELYNQLQKTAQDEKRGLWGSVKFEDLPDWLRKSNPDILK
ncbi:MAG: thermonuclease family protein [Planctomycetes bacterium]|nr:thermonuclease family protein [Planctomycetota bacterium]